jgi:hypothetical protein
MVRAPVPDNCEGPGNIVRQGIFRGTIRFRGEQGYTSVRRHSARGKVVEAFKKVCHERGIRFGPGTQGSGTQTVLLSGGKSEGRSVDFTASRFQFGPRLPTLTSYATSSLAQHDGLTVITVVSARGPEGGFSTMGEGSPPNEAVVEPPPPFSGSATFHLDSPRAATWSGTLSVNMPGIGEVALTGPGDWSALCVDAKCTKTLPSNEAIGFFSGSFRAGS